MSLDGQTTRSTCESGPRGAMTATSASASASASAAARSTIAVDALGHLLAAVHLDTGRIHHEIDDALFVQSAAQPAAVATGFITTWDGCAGAEILAPLALAIALRTAAVSPAATVQRLGARRPSPSESFQLFSPSSKSHVHTPSFRRILPTEGCVRRINLRAPSEKNGCGTSLFTPVELTPAALPHSC